MPHLHLEYTANLTGLAVEKTLLRLNNVLMASGQFGSEFDIKSRAVKVETPTVDAVTSPPRRVQTRCTSESPMHKPMALPKVRRSVKRS